MYDILLSMFASQKLTHQAKRKIGNEFNLATVDDHLILPQVFVWVCIDQHIQFKHGNEV